ncbi:efflux RND transporter periplasmic adaptor subunit [Ketobacter alkanivorans]|uniref:Efflux transporter periplasmic adaptor subunit n=1 Tax=Ketobacter alkanivorans TaxID=1917421 RepID=A0A2K9LL21_9GAMM|nr:efflux RND transporter periplasmic adaptor subunit [Ketobacter alkanivorans]AUM12185.1 efflux transporter periplasmic adaptor subunit [Ketobacter alkanivorans]
MNKIVIGVWLLVGCFIGAGLTLVVAPNLTTTPAGEVSQAKPEPLYWVAPMDPGYRRDQPGKSPMGMDLIPVYADASTDSGPGTVSISPEVVNNLGVRTVKAQAGALLTEINTVGYVQYNQDKLIHIHPRVQGWVEKLYLKAEGDPVRAGQPLYDLYSPALVNAQEEMVLALERNNTRLISAAQDRLRALQLSDTTIQQLRKTRKVHQTITVYSPQDGVIDNLNIREGFFIQPGTTVMSIGSLDEVWVEAEVFERQASLVQVGAPVSMTLDYTPGKEWLGKVDYVYPTLDEKTRTIKLRMRFDNPNRQLKPNMFAQVTVHAQSSDSAVLIPREALIRTGKVDRVVLALGDGRFKSINVQVGRIAENNVEILAGIMVGDDVVSSAQFLLDSESSKTSDFMRMHYASEAKQNASAEVMGVIRSIDAASRNLNIDREAIPKWNRGPANMDFNVMDGVDLAGLKVGMRIHFMFEVSVEGEFMITRIHAMPIEPKGADHGAMSHD